MNNITKLIAAEAQTGNKQIIMFALLGVMIVAMIFMSIIPQRKRKKQQQEMMASLKSGTKIKTIGGFIGEIVAFDEAAGTIVLNIGRNDQEVLVTIDRSAIYQVLSGKEPAAKLVDGKNVTEENTTKKDEVLTQDDIEAQEKAEEKAKEKAEKKNKKEEVKEVEVKEESSLL